LVPFKTLDEANGFVEAITHSQLLPASIETLNALAVRKMKYNFPLPSDGNYVVAIGLEGVAESTERQISDMGNIGKKHGALELTPEFRETSCSGMRFISPKGLRDIRTTLPLNPIF
jgi:hypothetical protein